MTHYTHWFQPLTDGTAEKHDGFIEFGEDGEVIERFSGKLLIQQEPDASSFPNGGIRNTFEARGYTAWDVSSPAFVVDTTLCIPTIFISYTGEALDYKTPLLKALAAVDKAATEVCQLFDKNITRVSAQWIKTAAVILLVAANAVNGTKGSLGGSYLSSIISDYTRELGSESSSQGLAGKPLPRVDITTQNLYNPTLNYKLFMIPALMVMLLTLICGFLPALNVVGEKEAGTIEQINVTPVGKFTFIAAKLIPYWLIGFVVLTICFVLAWVLYGILPAGHFLTIYGMALFFLPVVSGFGLVISNHSTTLQQAMFVMWFFMLILILMSGLFTPIHSMPEWAQWITNG